MVEWKGKYKCRLCGEIFTSCMTANESVAKRCLIGMIVGEKLEMQQPDVKTIHFCDDGSFGYADFIGMKKEGQNND